MKRFFDVLHAAAEQGYAGDRVETLRDPSALFGRGVPRLLRDRLEGYALSPGDNSKSPAWAICHPDSAESFRALAKVEFDSEGWRKAIATLSRLSGKAVAQQTGERPAPGRAVASDDVRAARASGGAAKLSRAAETARKEIATATKPIARLPDETVAHALKLAARYS